MAKCSDCGCTIKSGSLCNSCRLKRIDKQLEKEMDKWIKTDEKDEDEKK